MSQLQNDFQKIIELMGFSDFSINYDSVNNHLSVIIDDELISEENLPGLVNNLDCLMRLIAQKTLVNTRGSTSSGSSARQRRAGPFPPRCGVGRT